MMSMSDVDLCYYVAVTWSKEGKEGGKEEGMVTCRVLALR